MSTAHHWQPPLREGDRLTRDEFLRRWELMPDLKFAELIDGQVHMPSPVSRVHAGHELPAIVWLGIYASATPGCWAGAHPTWLMGRDDAPQPDVLLQILPEFGGKAGTQGMYGCGAPELIVEISYTSAAYDLGPKLKLYQTTGVQEYLTHLVRENQIVWRQLIDSAYQPIRPDGDGLLRSRVFPGLWLDPEALLRGDTAAVLTALQKGLASPEHAEFVQRLAKAGQERPAG